MYNPIALNGKLVLVTGASSGIGRAAAVTLHRLGAEVILSGRREQALGETENLLADGASGCSIEPFDLTDVDQIPDWLRRVRERRGRPLNGLVHCAGVGRYAPIATLTRKKIEEMCIPNLYSSVGIIRGFGQKGIAAEGASVVLVSSVASLTASPGMLAYSASAYFHK